MKKKYIVFMMSIALMTPECVAEFNDYQKKMFSLTSALTKLSAAVEKTLKYNNPDQNLSDKELLELSTKHDESLLEPFHEYKVKILRENKHAILLVCDVRALFEDLGCTKDVDRLPWMPKQASPCTFTLTSKECKE
jgi:hypothetical protein